MQKEFGGYLGRCLFECDNNFRTRYPIVGVDYTPTSISGSSRKAGQHYTELSGSDEEFRWGDRFL